MCDTCVRCGVDMAVSPVCHPSLCPLSPTILWHTDIHTVSWHRGGGVYTLILSHCHIVWQFHPLSEPLTESQSHWPVTDHCLWSLWRMTRPSVTLLSPQHTRRQVRMTLVLLHPLLSPSHPRLVTQYSIFMSYTVLYLMLYLTVPFYVLFAAMFDCHV